MSTARRASCYLLASFVFFASSFLIRPYEGNAYGDSKPYDDFRRIITQQQQPFQISDLIHISLMLSGVGERDLQSFNAQFQNYLGEVRSHVKSYSNEYESGKALLAYLHETRLKRYHSSQSAIHTLLKNGKFNCLSSTVLYIICARGLGLTVEPISTPNHVFCRLRNGETWIDVETTTRYGFNPGIRTEFLDEFGRPIGSMYMRPGKYDDRDVISEGQLLSLMLQAQLPEKDPNILRIAIDWYMLFPTKDAQRNLDYAYTNYVDWLNDEDLYDHALTFVTHYKKQFESDPGLLKSVQALLHRQLLVLIDKNRLHSAEQLLDEGSNILAVNLRRLLAEALLGKAMREGKRMKQYTYVLNLTSRLVANGHLPKARGDDYLKYMNAQQKHVLAGGK